MTFNEILGQIKSDLKATITKDSSKEQIDSVAALDKKLDDLLNSHEDVVKENRSLKDDYIDIVKNTKFTNASDDNPSPNGGAKTLEDIINDVIANRKK